MCKGALQVLGVASFTFTRPIKVKSLQGMNMTEKQQRQIVLILLFANTGLNTHPTINATGTDSLRESKTLHCDIWMLKERDCLLEIRLYLSGYLESTSYCNLTEVLSIWLFHGALEGGPQVR